MALQDRQGSGSEQWLDVEDLQKKLPVPGRKKFVLDIRFHRTADLIIQSPLVMCHYPFAPPEGIVETLGHRLEGAEHLRRFLQDKGPLLYCHGHVHVPWVFSPPSLTDMLGLNPGATLKMAPDEGSNGRMLEVVLNGTEVEIKRHTLRSGNWEVTDLKRITDFFRKGRAM